MNNNPGLPGILKQKTGMEALAVIDLHITDLLPKEPKPTLQTIENYRLTLKDIDQMTKRTVIMLKEILPKGM